MYFERWVQNAIVLGVLNYANIWYKKRNEVT